MPDPIPADILSATADAIGSQPAGSSAAHLARVALEAAVPLLRPEGTVTEFGVRFTLAGSVEESAVPDEAGARRAVESMRQNHPDFEPIVMVQREAARPAGPWTEVPGEDGSND